MNLSSHMREIRIRVHNMNINVVWLCLEKQPTPDEPIGGPMLSGQSAAKFAAGCDYILYHRSFQPNATTPLQWDVRTRRFGQYQAGGRDEGLLPDPLGFIEELDEESEDGKKKQIWVPDCTYRTFALAMDISEKEALTPPPPPSTAAPMTQEKPKPPVVLTATSPMVSPSGPVRGTKPTIGKPIVTSR
jgi:hypothetical protein